MSKQSTFRLRWKGLISEPLSLGQISDKLRSGEISLIHNIEVEGSWITIREYFRTIGLSRSPITTATQIKNQESESNPPDSQAPESSNKSSQLNLEHTVRMGYLWCGSTFISRSYFLSSYLSSNLSLKLVFLSRPDLSFSLSGHC